MKIEKFEADGDSATFTLTGSRSGLANAFRRSISGSVPCFAIDRITFYENTSAMFDEYIAHRIGLIPIKTPASGYNEKDEILFSLEATGPSMVFSKQLVSADKEVEVANDKIPIIKLGPEQKLRIEGKAIMGTGSRHSKFQPGFVTYEESGDGSFRFSLESFGQMSPAEMVNKAASAIRDELKEVEKAAKKL
ncbi:MAG: DNA-directed RNA polymerase subunit D [Candidatus Micrarchaeota archaeon]|nr:DNA-directed RNA polymerase subunit D [Candidatus Micrarchaeota archaeon]